MKTIQSINYALTNGIHHIFDSTADKITEQFYKGEKVIKEDKGWTCIHLNIVCFLNAIELFNKINFDIPVPKNPKFLDVGAGIGEKVYIASVLNDWECRGLELREPYVEAGNKLINNFKHYERYYSSSNIEYLFSADALKYDNYKDWDIIYFYMPIANNTLEIELEKKICQDAKIGTIVLPFSQIWLGNAESLQCGWKRFKPCNDYDICFYQKVSNDSKNP